MIGLFKHNNPLALLLLIVLALFPFFAEKGGLDATSIVSPQPAVLEQALVNLLAWMGAGSKWINNMATVSLLLLEALLLNKMATDHKLLERTGLLPAMSFLLLNALSPVRITAFVLLSNLAMILLLRIMVALYKSSKPNNLLLAAGFTAGLLGLLKTPYLLLYIWLVVALLIIRPSSLKEAVVATIGFVLPYYFLAAGLYLNNNPLFQHTFSTLAPDFQLPTMTAAEISRLSFFIGLPWIGLAVANRQISKMMILNRKTYIIILLLFLTLMMAPALDQQQLIPLLHLLLVPGSLMMANLFAYHKKNYLPNLILVGMAILSLFR